MPVYEYWCPHCRVAVELIRPVAERDDTPLCRCGGSMERRVTCASLRFIGSGWQTPRPEKEKS
jgi:putative FmdB family regulatory protein